MKAILIACLVFVSVNAAGAITISDPNVSLTEQQQESVSTLFHLLVAVYDNDASLIPDEPNEIIALETSENPRDLIAWQIFKMLRYALDPNSAPPDENIPVISNEPNMSATSSVSISDPNTDSTITSTVETSEIEPLQQEQEMGSMQSMEQVEELTNPLGSRILESKTYRIATLPLEIEGHVVIPAGTKLIAPFDPNNNIIEVMPGGLLDMGKAAFCSDPNCPAVFPPVEILPEDPNQYFIHNFFGIYVRRGADPATCISNTFVNNCRVGIVIDESLTNPIRNVITFGCYDGIYLYAPAQVIDSEFWYNGTLYEGIYSYPGVGVYIVLDGGQYPYPVVNISRTVTYSGDAGIYIESHNPDPNSADPNQAVPSVKVINSCLAVSYFFGIYKTEGTASIDVTYCAFGENYYDVNFDAPFRGA